MPTLYVRQRDKPLIKSLSHLKIAEGPPKTAIYFDAHIALGVAVVDAPMVAAEEEELRLMPWVRLKRHESSPFDNKFEQGSNWSIDIVHESAFEDYVSNHVLPFAERSAQKMLDHGVELAECEGFISGMKANRYRTCEPHLRPMIKRPTAAAVTSQASNVSSWLTKWMRRRR